MDGKIFETIVANGRYFGGGMLASPNSVLNDGKNRCPYIKTCFKI